ncbi:MAG: Ppx/GppA family phosphatase [Actinomycetia bacterium]|nr:Ppx/GppA family phosphatase [Actinomycetes bacterium]
MRLAAIDIGTVTTRLLVADVDVCGHLQQVLRFTEITQLGEGMAVDNMIKKAAAERVAEACRDFSEAMELLAKDSGIPVSRTTAYATSAMRAAENPELLACALAKLGIKVEVISGEREAELSFNGTLSAFPAAGGSDPEWVMLADIGGGSTELVVGRQGLEGALPSIHKRISLPLGARCVTDRFLQSDPPKADEIAAAQAEIRSLMQPFFQELQSQRLPIRRFFAVAGTATTLVSVRDQMKVYRSSQVHGQRVGRSSLVGILKQLAALSTEDRKQVVGLHPARADVVVGGLLILDELMAASALEVVTVSESDILQGIILESWQSLARTG